MYIYQRPEWPRFHLDLAVLANSLAAVRYQQGRLIGRMLTLGFPLQQDATLQTLTEDVVKTSEIEGDRLDPSQVRSSIARRLGIEIGGLHPADRHVDGVVAMILDATRQYDAPLTPERLFGWHAAMFPAGYSGMSKIRAGQWREDDAGPMQVVSGAVGREHVHFEAPPASGLKTEMAKFLDWFNASSEMDPVLRAGLAHLWFVTIHPFEDGNGRIARAIADMALAQSEKTEHRFYSMSAQIREQRAEYYTVLEQTQKASLDVTPWMEWFLACLSRAFDRSERTLAAVLDKARVWAGLSSVPLNSRQRLILTKLIDGFEGKLTTSKWAKLAKCSQDTAHRDIIELLGHGVLLQNPGGGRSTSYALATKAC